MDDKPRRPTRSGLGTARRLTARDEGSRSALPATLLVGAAVALIEPELLVGMGLGIATMLLPRLVPGMGGIFRPLLKSAVKAGYVAAGRIREIAAEAGEEFQDAVAEAQYEREQGFREREGRDLEEEDLEQEQEGMVRPARKAQA